MQVLEAEHEDEPNSTFFEEDEVDNREMYDGQLDEFDSTESLEVEPDQVDPTLDEMISTLCMPHSIQEPNLSDDELSQLDALADKVEILRLKGLGVLLPTSTLPPGGVKKLTTRFVRTWRDKFIGNTRYWFRRSRYVAREFSWLLPDRQDLFSPASSSITAILLSSQILSWQLSSACSTWHWWCFSHSWSATTYDRDLWIGFRWCGRVCIGKGATRPERWITSLVSSFDILPCRTFSNGIIPFVPMFAEVARLQVFDALACGRYSGSMPPGLSWWPSFEGFEDEVQDQCRSYPKCWWLNHIFETKDCFGRCVKACYLSSSQAFWQTVWVDGSEEDMETQAHSGSCPSAGSDAESWTWSSAVEHLS